MFANFHSKKKSVKRIFTGLLVLIFLFNFFPFSLGGEAEASGWYDLNWSSRKAILIDNSDNSSDLTDYQVKVETDDLFYDEEGLVGSWHMNETSNGDDNLLDPSTWTIGSGSVTGFNVNGGATENYRLLGTDPFGGSSVVWEARPDAASGADGGWNTPSFSVENSKMYRFAVWVQRPVQGNGHFYLGTYGYGSTNGVYKRSDGSTNSTNPYFTVNGNWTEWGDNSSWYLAVGHVWPAGSGGGSNHSESGIYNTSGSLIYTADLMDYVWRSETTSSNFRTYLYYSTNTATRQRWAYPRVDVVDGAEPSIESLIANGPNQVVEDSSGNNNTGAIVNFPSIVDGKFGKARSFNGADDYVEVKNSSSLNPSYLTMSFWASFHQDGNGNAFINKESQYEIGLSTDNKLQIALMTVAGGWVWVVDTGSALSKDQWHYIGIAYDGTYVYFYVDGALSSKVANNKSGVLTSTTNDLDFGCRNPGSSLYYMDLDEVRVYDRALSSDEIAELYNATDVRLDYGDVRFTDADGTTPLDYWMEEDGTFWVEVPSIPANSTKVIYLYYGNSSASSVSNATNVLTSGGLWLTNWYDGHGSHPTTEGTMDNLFSAVSYSSRDGWGPKAQVNCTNSACNLYGTDDNYLTLLEGWIYAPQAGTYTFATDSDDASDIHIGGQNWKSNIGGNNIVGWYDGHGVSSDWSHNGQINLPQGFHRFIYRQEEVGGGDAWKAGWQKSSDSSIDYIPSSAFYYRIHTSPEPTLSFIDKEPTPIDILADGKVNPSDIASSSPVLSAEYDGPSSSTATFYQVQVIADGGSWDTPYWDSTKKACSVAEGDRLEVTYDGTSLDLNQVKYYQRWMFWDQDNLEGGWSDGTDYLITVQPKNEFGANVRGFAWSDNIGWLSFNNSDISSLIAEYNSGTGELEGWGWSDNIGWISFNCATDDDCDPGTADHQVSVDGSGNLSGEAWSDNLGWLSFDRTDTGNPPGEPYQTTGAIARYDSGTKEFSGWAKFLEAPEGGWDGWIKLRCYGTECNADGWTEGTGAMSGVFVNDAGYLQGWAWGSDVIGWIGFQGPGAYDYGVAIDEASNKLSGHVWADNLGWISFDRDETGTPPSDDPCVDESCIARLREDNYQLDGWARVLNYGDGWDGWISLNKKTGDSYDYEVSLDVDSKEFEGWAYGSDVLGWISFNHLTDGSSFDYMVYTGMPMGIQPTDPHDTWDFCSDSLHPTLNWEVGGDINGYEVEIYSDADLSNLIYRYQAGVSSTSHHANYDADKFDDTVGTCHIGENGFQNETRCNLKYGGTDYWWRVRVRNLDNVWGNWSETDTFQVINNHHWPVPSFSIDPSEPSAGSTTTFLDESSTYGGATAAGWQWLFSGEEGVDYSYVNETNANSQNPEVSFSSTESETVSLKTTDSDGYGPCSCSGGVDITSGSIQWHEVSPTD